MKSVRHVAVGLNGYETPRIFTPARGELTPATSLGFECIRFAEETLGLVLRPWQKWLLIHGLELDTSTIPGHDDFDPDTPKERLYDYRFRTVIVEVGRQNGKTVVMKLLGLWRMFIDGASAILSAAQRLSVAEETLEQAFKQARAIPALSKYLPVRTERGRSVTYMRRANGSNQIQLDSIPPYLADVLDISGEMPTWYVVPTNTGGGRSYSADLVLLDELREHRTEDAWGSIVPTSIERPRSQVWAFSNAGDQFAVVLKKMRNIGLAAIEAGATDDEALGLFSWSAEPDVSIFDPLGWAQANPSLGWGTRTERDMLAMAKQAVDPTDPDASEDVFRTEYLCQWVDDIEAEPPVIDPEAWAGLVDLDPRRLDNQVGIGVDLDPTGSVVAIAAACRTERGIDISLHPVRDFERDETVEILKQVCAREGPKREQPPVGLEPINNNLTLEVPLAHAGVEVNQLTAGRHVAEATAAFLELVRAGEITHDGDPRLQAAVESAVTMRVGKVGDRFVSAGDSTICELNAAAWAVRELQRLGLEDNKTRFVASAVAVKSGRSSTMNF